MIELIKNIDWIDISVATVISIIVSVVSVQLKYCTIANYASKDSNSFLLEKQNGFGCKKYYQRGINDDYWFEINQERFANMKGARRAID